MIYTEIKQLNTRRENLRWNAWGSQDNDFAYAQQIGPLLNFVRRRLNMADTVTPSLRIADLRLPEPRIRGAALASLQRIFSKNRVKTDIHERVLHSAGRSYYDVLRLRMNLLKAYTDAVVYPETEAEIQKLLILAARNNWAVVPYGGGSSVVGGVEAVSGGKKAVVTLDMTRMNRLIALSPMNGTATFEAGVYGPDLEIALGKQGWTLGHFPQSFEYSTLGGWVAARSAGQQSSRYGKIEEIISAVRMITPAGVFETGHFPAGSTGPDFNQVICGSEGTLGIITSVTVKLHPLPDRRTYCGFLFPSFARGLDFLRHANQEGIGMSTLRLSDEDETAMLEAFGRIIEHGKVHPVKRFLKDSIQNIVLQASGLSESKCIVIAGADGDDSKHVIAGLKKIASRIGGMYAGTGPGQRWLKGRFNMPFLRNYLMEFGIGRGYHGDCRPVRSLYLRASGSPGSNAAVYTGQHANVPCQSQLHRRCLPLFHRYLSPGRQRAPGTVEDSQEGRVRCHPCPWRQHKPPSWHWNRSQGALSQAEQSACAFCPVFPQENSRSQGKHESGKTNDMNQGVMVNV
jgi:alkyldihydroxyacetonephosphate synthase